jgi:two-component system response regulator DesR
MSSALLMARGEERTVRISARRTAPVARETVLALVGGPQLVRAVTGDLIDAQPGIRVECSAASIDELEETCRSAPPRCDVALLDVDEYRGECTEAVDRVLALGLDCKLVLLCTEASGELLLCARSRRIDGVVLKESSVGELCDAVAHILTGHAVMPARTPSVPKIAPLTPRHVEVVKLISLGYSNHEIAQRLGVRPNTVKVHISEIFRRLGVRNRIEAIAQLAERDADGAD